MTVDTQTILENLEQELIRCIRTERDPVYSGFFEIFEYQMGWDKQKGNSLGKRVRPMLLLLTLQGLGEDWQKGLPAAASLEFIHNYSLIHDDIEDKSVFRHGKPTVWKKWGESQAINSGDALLSLALLVPWKLKENYSTDEISKVLKILQEKALQLTMGQYLDLSFEGKEIVPIIDYWKMIEGKTCSLIEAAFEIGAVLGKANDQTIELLGQSGRSLGMAYQLQDDWLGIWGDEAKTGKSSKSDLTTKKKTFPVLAGLEQKGEFARNWTKLVTVKNENIPELTVLLENEGIKELCEREFDRLYAQTFELIKKVSFDSDFQKPLIDYITGLLKRRN